MYDNQGNTRTVDCPPKMIRKQLRKGESYINGQINQRTHKVIDGSVVKMTKQEIDQKYPGDIPIKDEDQPISLTKKEYNSLLERINTLENN